MTQLILLLQQTNIEEKLKNSPDNGYQFGVLIGSFLPFFYWWLLLIGCIIGRKKQTETSKLTKFVLK
ncbi:hypothetical protein [Flavobacterium bomense]|uniref:hypothetical protein n=1 Tax=Flavobacterium bomense TaxID=2497483 RepID=UPI0018F5D5A4|nr:hypothetical protein [Flavobacterium bomense]